MKNLLYWPFYEPICYVVQEDYVRQSMEYLTLVDRIYQRSNHRNAQDARQVETIQIRIFAQPGDMRRKYTNTSRLFEIHQK